MYIMSYFRESALHVFLAKSDDLFNWEDVNGGAPVFQFEPGLDKIVRDPFIIEDRQGVYHLWCTDNWRSETLAHATSTDLIHWSAPAFVPVMKGHSDVQNCWAPECVYDEEQGDYLLFWSSRFTTEEIGNRIYACRTPDFCCFSDPFVLFDPGYPVIDASILYHQGIYHMCFKDERGFNRLDTDYKALRTCISKHAAGPYINISPMHTTNLCEGPTIIRKDGQFVVLYDSFGRHLYCGMQSEDFYHFSDITQRFHFPESCKHVTVFETRLNPR